MRRMEPGFEWHPDELSPAQRPRHSAEEAVDTVRDFTSPFSEFNTEVVGLSTHGAHVIAEVHHVGEVGAGQVERREAHVWTFRDGKPVSLREFETREEALAFLDSRTAPP